MSYCRYRLALPTLSRIQGLLGGAQVKAGNVAGVDHFHDQLDPGCFQLVRGVAQIVDQGFFDVCAAEALRADTDQAIDLAIAEHLGVGDGLIHAGAEFLDSVGVAGDTAFALGPIAGGQVEQHLFELVGVQAGFDFFRAEIVGEQVFDTAEAGFGGGGETVHEVHFCEQHRQVGGKTGHGVLLVFVARMQSGEILTVPGFHPGYGVGLSPAAKSRSARPHRGRPALRTR